MPVSRRRQNQLDRDNLAMSLVNSVSQSKEPGQYKVAINADDLTKCSFALSLKMWLRDRLDHANPIWIDKNRRDGAIIPFNCQLITACITCDVIRRESIRANQQSVRVYVRDGERWRMIPKAMPMCKVGPNKQPIVSNDVFKPQTMFIPMPLRVGDSGG